MRNALIAACLLLQLHATAQDSALVLTAAQRVASHYAVLLSLSPSEKAAVVKAVRALEQKDLYHRLLSFNIGRFTRDGKCYNLLAPADEEGALMLTVSSGTPQKLASGIRLHSNDLLDTHFINDLATQAPQIGMFCYTDTGMIKPVISSASPFNVITGDDGRAYVSIWAASAGMSLAPAPFVFSLGQRIDTTSVEFIQDTDVYTEALPVNSENPTGNDIYIKGNDQGECTLKVFGFTEALTAQQAADLKQIIDQLMHDLGI